MDIVSLKKKHRHIYAVTIGDYQIIFRTLTWREHEIWTRAIVTEQLEPSDIEFRIFTEVVLDPNIIDDINHYPAGVISSVAALSLYMSGINLTSMEEGNRLNEMIAERRQILEVNALEQFISIICKAFPSMTPLEIEELPFAEVLRLLVIAEQILGLEPVQIVKKEEEKSFLDKAFKDKDAAQHADSAGISGNTDIRDILDQQKRERDRVVPAQETELRQELLRRSQDYSRRYRR